MTKEEFKANVSMAYNGRGEWEEFLEAVWQLHNAHKNKANMTEIQKIIDELALEYANKNLKSSPYDAFRDGMKVAFDFANQEFKNVIIEHFGTDEKYADEVECLFNAFEERLKQ